MQIVVLVHPVTVISCISPSTFVRGVSKRYSGKAPWQRCDNFSGPEYDCHTQSESEIEAKTYDTCLNPEYQQRSGTRGWMAIANLDSINPRRRNFMTQAPTSTMGTFLQSLNSQIPGEGKKAVTWAYTDNNKQAGYPEIALYPYKNHKGLRVVKRYCPNEEAAMRLLEKEAANDNLNYLPIAAFTKHGVIDMVNGFYRYDRLDVRENSFNVQSAQEAILKNVHSYMEVIQTKGIVLPHYGAAKMSFDSRTGFFVLDSVVPTNLFVLNGKLAYRSLLMSLQTPQAQVNAMKYMLIFRNFMPEHFMEPFEIHGGFKPYRAMIFNRYPVLTNLFTDLGFNIPVEYREPLGRAGRLYRSETARVNKVVTRPQPSGLMPITIPKEQAAQVTPEYAAVTPEYAAVTPEASNQKGGKKQNKTQRSHHNLEHSAREYAALFASVWKNKA